jgi:hypothetical protein
MAIEKYINLQRKSHNPEMSHSKSRKRSMETWFCVQLFFNWVQNFVVQYSNSPHVQGIS